MQSDISVFTFCTDFQFQAGDLIARIPSNIQSKSDLFSALKAQLPLPPYVRMNWDNLINALRSPQDWTEHTRIVLVHEDIPLLHTDWYAALIYLEVVIHSIQDLETQSPSQPCTSSTQNTPRVLSAVFPDTLYDEVWALLDRAPVWEASIGTRSDTDRTWLLRKIEPMWEELQTWLERLDGVTIEYFELVKDTHASLTVTYLQQHAGYYIIYEILAKEKTSSPYGDEPLLLSSPIEQDVLTHFLSLAEVIPIARYFHEHEHLPTTSQWYTPAIDEHDLHSTVVHWYYGNEETEFIERSFETVHTTIYDGMAAKFRQEQKLFTIQDWQDLLLHQDVSLKERLITLCVLGIKNTPAIYETFLALLESPHRQERWLGAHFLGLRHDERALPIILTMLTEDLLLPYDAPGGEQCYDWRKCTPRLLRIWATDNVRDTLHQALQTWIAAEPHFSNNESGFAWWIDFEAKLCYELGYRDAYELVLQSLSEATHHKFLLVNTARGYLAQSLHLPLQDEYENLQNTYTRWKTEICHILQTKAHLSEEQAKILLQEYSENYYDLAY